MLFVIAYDVVDDGRRRRVMDTLKDFGRRVQYSVFECDLDARALEELAGRLRVELDESADSCRVYRLCAACAAEVRILGLGEHYSEPGFVVI